LWYNDYNGRSDYRICISYGVACMSVTGEWVEEVIEDKLQREENKYKAVKIEKICWSRL
jgi:hypothetical protein